MCGSGEWGEGRSREGGRKKEGKKEGGGRGGRREEGERAREREKGKRRRCTVRVSDGGLQGKKAGTYWVYCRCGLLNPDVGCDLHRVGSWPERERISDHMYVRLQDSTVYVQQCSELHMHL